MKRGFTLIELIFVIVIIGILGAVAVPKFLNLKQNAEAANIVKTVNDAISSVPSSYINFADLEEKEKDDLDLNKLLEIKGKGWSYVAGTDGDGKSNGKYEFRQKTGGDLIAYLELLDDNRTMKYQIDCDKFADPKTQEKCKGLWGATNSAKDLNLSW